jgi:hypothetical protein
MSPRAGPEDLCLEPGEQLRVTVRFAEQAAVRITPDALLRLDHVAREPDQVIAQHARPLVGCRVRAQLLQDVDHHGRRVRPPPVERALAGGRTLGNTLEREPPETDLSQLSNNGVRNGLLDCGCAPPPADRALDGLGHGGGLA